VIAFSIAIRESMWVGVDLFFALSGFLITGILFDSLSGSHFLRNFYGRRAVRIFPLYYLALFMVWLMGLPIAMHWSGYQWVLIAYLDNTRLWIGHAVPHPLVDLTGHL
jgi:peptidoglycan/LPS O-acetylase OafA/YrhL